MKKNVRKIATVLYYS